MILEVRIGGYDVGPSSLWWVVVEWTANSYPYEWRTSRLDFGLGWMTRRGITPDEFRLTIREDENARGA